MTAHNVFSSNSRLVSKNKINTVVYSQVQKCDAETSGTDVADCDANTVDQEV